MPEICSFSIIQENYFLSRRDVGCDKVYLKLHEGFPPKKVKAAFIMTFPHLQSQGSGRRVRTRNKYAGFILFLIF
jgi:hypothetical protein